MSSNNNHNIPVLTRTNYEEAFLMYVDGELTPEDRQAVEAFAAQHPDLAEELDLLQSTKLPGEDVPFSHKETLFADSMKVAAIDEDLLLYIDNELPPAEEKAVEEKLKRDEAFSLQHALLLQTKLAKDETLVYPYKKELYRHTARRIAPVWLRIAAAVILVAGAGTVAWFNMDVSKSSDPVVAVVTPKKDTQQQTAPAIKPFETLAVPEKTELAAAHAKQTIALKEKKKEAGNTIAVVKRAPKKSEEKTFLKPHTAQEPVVASNQLPVAKKEEGASLKSITSKEQKNAVPDNSAVTSDATTAYVSREATTKTTVPVTAAATTTDGARSGGTVKGFLRKATRFIERRTGVKAVNDDDELLVGAVALKL